MFEWFFFLYHICIYQPLLNILFFLYDFLPGNDFGIAIVVLTLGIRMLLYPMNNAAIKAQKALADLQPKLKELQEKLRDRKEELARETLALYREARVNPFASMLPLLVQVPILIALFRLLGKNLGNGETASLLYPFVKMPEKMSFELFGLLDGTKPYLALAIVAGTLQFIQTKMMTQATAPAPKKHSEFERIFQQQTLYFFPFFTFLILLRLPSALALYWIVTTIFSIYQQYIILRAEKIKP
jgi:YidC/Oxa1 family membrane protein insertase